MSRGQPIERVVDQGALARPGYAGDARDQAQRNRNVYAVQVVAPGAANADHGLGVELAPLGGQGNLPPSRQVLSGQRSRIRADLFGRALGNDAAAVHAGAGSQVDHVIRRQHRFGIVFHDQDGVAQVPEMPQGFQKSVVVPLMQPYRGLVEDVHHAHQAGADLAGQPYSLGFTAGQRLRAAVQRQVVQAHVRQEAQPVANLLHDPVGNLGTPSLKLKALEEPERLPDATGGDIGQRPPTHVDMPRGFVQARSAAALARLRTLVIAQRRPYRVGLGLPVTPLHVRNDALEGVLPLPLAAAFVDVAELDPPASTAVQHDVANLRRKFLERRFDIEVVVRGQRLDEVEVIGIVPVPTAHRPARQRKVRVAYHPAGIEEPLHAEAVALLAGADGAVERKQPRLQFRNPVTAHRAGELAGKNHWLAVWLVHEGDLGHAVGQRQRGFERLGQAQAGLGTHAKPVHHGLDGVVVVAVQRRRFVQVANRPVDTHTHEPACPQFRERVGVGPLSGSYHRRQQHDSRAFLEAQYLVHHLRDALRIQHGVVGRAARHAGAGKQQPQVVVDLRDRPHGGTRIVGCGLLLDGDGRRQPLDVVHRGLLHHREELPRVRGQRFHVTALPLGVDRVERQRGLARSGQPGQHDHPVPGQIEIDVLEVVSPRAADSYVGGGHVRWARVNAIPYYTPSKNRGAK